MLWEHIGENWFQIGGSKVEVRGKGEGDVGSGEKLYQAKGTLWARDIEMKVEGEHLLPWGMWELRERMKILWKKELNIIDTQKC